MLFILNFSWDLLTTKTEYHHSEPLTFMQRVIDIKVTSLLVTPVQSNPTQSNGPATNATSHLKMNTFSYVVFSVC